jgi:hypothetical protein
MSGNLSVISPESAELSEKPESGCRNP